MAGFENGYETPAPLAPLALNEARNMAGDIIRKGDRFDLSNVRGLDPQLAKGYGTVNAITSTDGVVKVRIGWFGDKDGGLMFMTPPRTFNVNDVRLVSTSNTAKTYNQERAELRAAWKTPAQIEEAIALLKSMED